MSHFQKRGAVKSSLKDRRDSMTVAIANAPWNSDTGVITESEFFVELFGVPLRSDYEHYRSAKDRQRYSHSAGNVAVFGLITH